MAEFLASILGVGVLAILIGMLKHHLKQREWEKRTFIGTVASVTIS